MKFSLPNLSTEISLFGSVSHVELFTFTKHSALLLKSGIALAEAIDILEKQASHATFRKILQKVHHDIANGQHLYAALAKFPRVFDSFYINLVKVAEESGTLEENLEYLAQHLKKQHDFSTKVKSALLYPAIVLGLAVVVATGLSIFVLPKLLDLFASLDVELPLSTKILLFFAQLMKDYGVLIFMSMIGSIALLKYATTTALFKPRWDSFVLSLPVVGVFIQNIHLAAIFRNLGMMLSAGVPIDTAVNVEVDTTSNTVYKKVLKDLHTGLSKGKTLESVLSHEPSRYTPLIVTRMIGVGEKTGKLDSSFAYLGDYFEDEVDTVSKNLSTILEPILLVMVGLVVAFIALAIIGPIYQFTGSIKR